MKAIRFTVLPFYRVNHNLAPLICLTLVAAASAAQTTATSQAARPLDPGKPIERKLAAGESQAYEVRLTKGQFMRATFDQRGIDVVIDVFGPTGGKIASVDGPTGA